MISPPTNISAVPANEIGARQQLAVEKRAPVRGRRVHGEQVEAEPGDSRLDPALARIEPVLQLATVKHQLQRADPKAQGTRRNRTALDASCGCGGRDVSAGVVSFYRP